MIEKLIFCGNRTHVLIKIGLQISGLMANQLAINASKLKKISIEGILMPPPPGYSRVGRVSHGAPPEEHTTKFVCYDFFGYLEF